MDNDDTQPVKNRDSNSKSTPKLDRTKFQPRDGSVPGNERTRLKPFPKPRHHYGLPIREGSAIKGRFILEELLGAGGMGVVYKAKDLLKVEAQDRDPYVAIKLLNEEFKSHPEAFIALQREARKSQRIAHPNIVNVHDFDRDGDTVFMTMEYLQGKPLDSLISQYRSTGLPREEVFVILEGMCSALSHAHKEDIIHSDFKPGNIYVTQKGIAKIFDFGIARAVAKAEKFGGVSDDDTVFDVGSLGALTPAYASLEMLQGTEPDIRDDIYALGCIAYEMFSGQHPYKRMHADEAFRQKLKVERHTNIERREWKAIEQAIALKREDRIESVEEFWRKFSKKGLFSYSPIFSIPASPQKRYDSPPKRPFKEKLKLSNKRALDPYKLVSYRYKAPKQQSAEQVSHEDKLNRQKLVDTLATFLAEPSNSHHQTIGLLGDWGIGKSSVIQLLKSTLLEKHSDQAFLFSYFSAWEYEHTDNLQAGIAQEVIKTLSDPFPPKPKQKDNKQSFIQRFWQGFMSSDTRRLFWLPNRLYITWKYAVSSHGARILYLLILILAALMPAIFPSVESALFSTGSDASTSVELGVLFGKLFWIGGFLLLFMKEFKKVLLNPLAKEMLTYLRLPDFGKHLGTIPVMRKNIETLVKIRLRSRLLKPLSWSKPFIKRDPVRLVFVVDDLDRCSHEGIVKVFEAIRLILDLENVVVVIAVDHRIALAALAHHHEKMAHHHQLRNARLIARDYLAKVIHLPITLGEPEISDIQTYLKNIWLKTSKKEKEGKWIYPRKLKEDIPEKEMEELAERLMDSEAVTEEEKTRLNISNKTRIDPKVKSRAQDETRINTVTDIEETRYQDSETRFKPFDKTAFPGLEANEVAYIEGLDLFQQKAFLFWLEHFQLFNPRQVKRLNNSYNIVCSYFDEDLELLDFKSEWLAENGIRTFPLMVGLFALEYLNSLDDLNLRNQLKGKLKGLKVPCQSEDPIICNDVVLIVNRPVAGLTRHILDAIEPFVLPTLEVNVRS